MASNIYKVEEKAAKDLDKAIKTSRTGSEIERRIDPKDVSCHVAYLAGA